MTTIVWRTPLGVHAYAAAGRDLVVPRMACPACSNSMVFWGWYQRDVRVGDVFRVLVRRMFCGVCRATHAVLPEFVARGRLDGIDVIGETIALMVAGMGMRPAAVRAGVPHTTARDWRRRFGARAELLVAGFIVATVAVSGRSPKVSGGPEVAAVGAVGALWEACERRSPGQVGSRWRLANVVVGSHVLSTNTNPPWAFR